MKTIEDIDLAELENQLKAILDYPVSCECAPLMGLIGVNVYNVPISEFSAVSNAVYDFEEEKYSEFGGIFLVLKYSPEQTNLVAPHRALHNKRSGLLEGVCRRCLGTGYEPDTVDTTGDSPEGRKQTNKRN